jgi:hypothetical protein
MEPGHDRATGPANLLHIAGMGAMLFVAAGTLHWPGALLAGLPGYAEYTARVRYRLVPGIW